MVRQIMPCKCSCKPIFTLRVLGPRKYKWYLTSSLLLLELNVFSANDVFILWLQNFQCISRVRLIKSTCLVWSVCFFCPTPVYQIGDQLQFSDPPNQRLCGIPWQWVKPSVHLQMVVLTEALPEEKAFGEAVWVPSMAVARLALGSSSSHWWAHA